MKSRIAFKVNQPLTKAFVFDRRRSAELKFLHQNYEFLLVYRQTHRREFPLTCCERIRSMITKHNPYEYDYSLPLDIFKQYSLPPFVVNTMQTRGINGFYRPSKLSTRTSQISKKKQSFLFPSKKIEDINLKLPVKKNKQRGQQFGSTFRVTSKSSVFRNNQSYKKSNF